MPSNVIGPSMGALSSGSSDVLATNAAGFNLVAAQNAQSTQQELEQAQLTAIRTFAEMVGKTAKAGLDAMKGLI